MFDLLLRPVKDQVLGPFARAIGRSVSPMTVTIAALAAGLAAAAFIARGAYGMALVLWGLNRVLDGLDGSLARVQGSQTALGGYIDIVLDFVVYAAVPISFVIATPDASLALAALVLLGSFFVNAASWMYLAAILEQRNQGASARAELTTITMPEGVVGGTETVVFYALFLLLPRHLVLLFGIMSVLVLASVAQRLIWAVRRL